MSLQKIIGQKITQIPITWIEKDKRGRFNEVNDSRIVWDVTFPWMLFGLIGIVSLMLIFLIYVYVTGIPQENVKSIIAAHLLFGCPLILCCAYGLVQQRKILIFDRENQTVTIPRPFFFKSFVVPWSDASAMVVPQIKKTPTKHLAGIYVTSLGVGFTKPAVTISIAHDMDYPQSSWSFWLWYMDKNRPLPPSTSLDPYREAEIERLRKEGFPAPNTPCFFYELVIDGISYPTGTPCEGMWPPV